MPSYLPVTPLVRAGDCIDCHDQADGSIDSDDDSNAVTCSFAYCTGQTEQLSTECRGKS